MDYEKLSSVDLVLEAKRRALLPEWFQLLDIDDNAARLVRDRIAELGLQDDWCRAINNILEPARIAQPAAPI